MLRIVKNIITQWQQGVDRLLVSVSGVHTGNKCVRCGVSNTESSSVEGCKKIATRGVYAVRDVSNVLIVLTNTGVMA